MASTHPNSIFRWEDSASLEHACWQCPTKANSPRALQTCYGIHSMPCTSYHPTMHAVGAAHRCSGCVNTREMHEARHREIAELVAEYKALESPPPETPSRTPLLERNVNTIGSAGSERRRNLFDSPSEANDTVEIAADSEHDEDESTSLSSYTPSTTGIQSTPSRKPTKAEIRNQKKARKAAKSQSKALKNQNRNLAAVTAADVDQIAEILHGDSSDAISDDSAHPLATDKAIEDVIARNLNFVKNIQAHKQYLFLSVATGRKEQKERKRQKKRENQGDATDTVIEMDEVVSAIMIKLGLPASVVSATTTAASITASPNNNNPFKNTLGSCSAASSGRKRSAASSSSLPSLSTSCTSGKSGVAIAQKLRAAIKTDLEKHENEVHARYVRAGGFWRYVGKTVFERMTEVASDLDVNTGEKWDKKRAREEKTSEHREDERSAVDEE